MSACALSRFFSLSLLLAILATNLHGASTRKTVEEGNRAYRAGHYDQALAKYKAALSAGGDPAVVSYNLGNAHYEMGESEAAQKAYTESLRPHRPHDLEESVYNLGNAYFQGQKFPEAISAYIEALKLNPDDEDAKYNLELAQRMLTQMQRNQSQQTPQPQDQEEREERERQEQQEQEQIEEQEPQETPRPEKQEERQMTPEEAERLLNALLQDEQDALEEVKKTKVASRPKREKDW